MRPVGAGVEEVRAAGGEEEGGAVVVVAAAASRKFCSLCRVLSFRI